MAATDITRDRAVPVQSRARRLATETKSALKTTEFYAYVVVTIGVLIAGAVTKAGDGHDDRFLAKNAWLYVAILTVGYMISRGLAKSGSREPYSDDDDR
ncbi:MAG: hypothetical protein ACJ760_03070 [Thermoleophilaceae bacterium]